MQRVEFVGPPGAGKSTIFRELASAAHRQWDAAQVCTAGEAKRRVLTAGIHAAGRAKRLARKLVYSVPVFRHELVVERVPAFAWDLLYERSDLAPLVGHVLHGSECTGSDQIHNLRRMQFFVRDITDFALLERYTRSKVTLHDESLLHRGLGFAFGSANCREFLERYCSLVPVPALLVYVTAEPCVLADRIRRRSGEDSPWLSRLEDAVALASLVAERAADRGARVLTLDGADGKLSENTAACVSAVDGMLSHIE